MATYKFVGEVTSIKSDKSNLQYTFRGSSSVDSKFVAEKKEYFAYNCSGNSHITFTEETKFIIDSKLTNFITECRKEKMTIVFSDTLSGSNEKERRGTESDPYIIESVELKYGC